MQTIKNRPSYLFNTSDQPDCANLHCIYGEIDQTIFSNISRDSFLNLPVEKVTPFLKALRLFFDTCYDSKNIVRVKLDEGKTEPNKVVSKHKFPG